MGWQYLFARPWYESFCLHLIEIRWLNLLVDCCHIRTGLLEEKPEYFWNHAPPSSNSSQQSNIIYNNAFLSPIVAGDYPIPARATDNSETQDVDNYQMTCSAYGNYCACAKGQTTEVSWSGNVPSCLDPSQASGPGTYTNILIFMTGK